MPKKTTKAKGAAVAAPIVPLRSEVLFRFPAFTDELTGQTFRATGSVPMYSQQIDGMDLAEVMDVARVEASADGFVLHLVHGMFRYQPDGWDDAWGRLALPTELKDWRAFAAIRAVSSHLALQSRERGKRGPAKDEFRDFLLADALCRMAQGASMRPAVEATLEEYAPDENDSALLSALARHLRQGKA